jgi:disulfide bond formation protein DsbB
MSWRGPALILVLVAALYVIARPWLLETFGAATLVLVVFGAGMVVSITVAWWQARNRLYTCPACAHVFGVSMLRNLASQNWFGRLHAHCPSCGEQSWCDLVSDGAEPAET